MDSIKVFSMQEGVLHLIIKAGPVVKFVMVMLLLFSVVSWAVIFFKFRYLSRATKENEAFYNSFRRVRNSEMLMATSKRFLISPMSNVFRSVYSETGITDREEFRRSLKRFEALETAKLEAHLGFLATTGSTTPFIGLFGTVWGIMDSFMGISKTGSASLAIVAPGIAEALIATAMGLVAAIPAVISYNYYLGWTRRIIIEMEDFSEEILNMFTRESGEGRQA